MTEEDFDDWKDNEVTKSFLALVKTQVIQSEEAWGAAINGGVPDEQLPLLRARLNERAVLATEIVNVSYEDLAGDDEQERSDTDRVQGSG